jgi:hypothetical protein
MPPESSTIKPKLPLPDPIRGADPDSFAQYTFTERLPNIARQVTTDGSWSSEAVQSLTTLVDVMPEGLLSPLLDNGAPDSAEWERFLRPHLDQTWLQAPWFVAEMYFFRRVIASTGYLRPGPGSGVDPYAPLKTEGLKPVLGALRTLYAHTDRLLPKFPPSPHQIQETLAFMLRKNTWGNQADLSLWPADDGDSPARPGDDLLTENLLVDHAAHISRYLIKNAKRSQRVDFVLDNGGLELAYDLALADFLLRYEIARVVHLHTKPFPTYVSDATTGDVLSMLDYLKKAHDQQARDLAQRLFCNIQNGSLILKDDFYWTFPLSGWEMPSALKNELQKSDLIVSKGDANYRRWMGDRHWPFTTPLEDILNYIPAPLALMRVFKSNCLTGIKPGQVEVVGGKDPDWLYDGKWGVIQFYSN